MTDHLPALNDALQRRTLALFIGADLQIAGLPSRADLARDLAHRRGLDASLSLAQAAQRVSRGGSRHDFTSFIMEALSGHAPGLFHRRVVEFVQAREVSHVVTTAYDDLLWRAFRDVGARVQRVVRGSDVHFISPDRVTLVHLYGDAQQPDTLVVTEDDHYGLWRNKQDVLDEVRAVLRGNVVLFVGYNLSDPDFNLLWREVLDRAGRFARGAYAVWPGLPEAERQVWQERGIVILETDPLGILGEAAVQAAPSGRPEATVTLPAGAERPAWDMAAIRRLLTDAFDDQDLTNLCFDAFPAVYEDLSVGMSKGQKVQRLLDYCRRRDQVETLLRAVEGRNPTQYARFASRLRREPPPAGDT